MELGVGVFYIRYVAVFIGPPDSKQLFALLGAGRQEEEYNIARILGAVPSGSDIHVSGNSICMTKARSEVFGLLSLTWAHMSMWPVCYEKIAQDKPLECCPASDIGCVGRAAFLFSSADA